MKSAKETAEALLMTSIRGNRQEEPDWQAGYASMTTSNGRNLLYKEFARQARHLGFACRVPHWNNGSGTVVSIEYASDSDSDTSEEELSAEVVLEPTSRSVGKKRSQKVSPAEEDQDHDSDVESEDDQVIISIVENTYLLLFMLREL